MFVYEGNDIVEWHALVIVPGVPMKLFLFKDKALGTKICLSISISDISFISMFSFCVLSILPQLMLSPKALPEDKKKW